MAAHTLFKLPTTTTTSTTLFSEANTGRRPESLPCPWLGTGSVSLQYSNIGPQVRPKRRPLVASVVSSLPTANPERFSSAKQVPKWSLKAIKAFAFSELEARKLRYSTTGTESLLMGILVEGTSVASKFLRANGITLLKVRDETVKLLGEGDRFYFSPEHPPLTEAAQRVLDRAVDQKLKAGDGGEITTADLLLGVWSEVESPGFKIMATYGFNDEKAKELESLCSEPGFIDD